MSPLRGKNYLFLLLLLRLLDEAVHDASRDDHGGEDCLGQDDHCLVFHLDLLSWPQGTVLFSVFTLTWIFCQLSSLTAQITG